MSRLSSLPDIITIVINFDLSVTYGLTHFTKSIPSKVEPFVSWGKLGRGEMKS
jgi:phage-related protein